MIPVAEFIAATSHTPPEHRRKASDIIGAVCDMAGVDMQELLGRSRAQPLAAIRQYAMWKVRKETALSLPQIAHIFKRDHTTVIHACREVERRLGGKA